MTRATNNPASRRRRKKVLEQAKGYYGARKTRIRLASEATNRAMAFAFRGRKEKKRDLRALWIVRISAASKMNGVSYSRFMDTLKKMNIILDRKILADLAVKEEKVFAKLASLVQK